MVNPANGNLAVNQSQQLWGATPAEYEEAAKVKKKYASMILSLPGVEGVGVRQVAPEGVKFIRAPIGLAVYVRDEAAREKLDALISDKIEGVWVGFVVSGNIVAQKQ